MQTKSYNSLYFLFFLITSTIVYSQQNLDDGYAVSGYDVVSYFDNSPLQGVSKFQSKYKGAIYKFSNETNKNRFEADPMTFVPEYGGWCAYAMGAKGKKVEINPLSYNIEDNKLYLFYRTTFTNTRQKWLSNTNSLKSKANKNWSKFQNK